jgi:fucose permease
VPCFVLACLAYLAVALPGSAIGLLWPPMRISIHQPVGALGVLLALGVVASVVSSTAAGRVLSRVGAGPLVAAGTALVALALAVEALAPSVWAMAIGFTVFGLGFGITNSAANVHAARHFGARKINWMHASYGLGATVGPLAVTVILGSGLTWRWAYGSMAVALAVLAFVLVLGRRAGEAPARDRSATGPAPERDHAAEDAAVAPAAAAARKRRPAAAAAARSSAAARFGGLVFAAVETGIESGAGIWGYVFMISGRGLSHQAAGIAVSAYWAMMFAGRAVLGPVAQRWGPDRVLGSAVAGVVLGAALMAVPGPRWVAVAGIMTVGVAAAPIFPLFTLTTSQRLGGGDSAGATHAVSLQVAASAAGNAALPAGIGLVIGADARALAPALLVLGVAMCGVYWLLVHPAGTGSGTGTS